MKGIILSFDPHLEIANLVVETYNRLWPGCPFQFRIPFTDRDPKSIFRADNVEFVRTPPDIRNTMENLLRDLPDAEFVFWCVDDRYPIEIYHAPVLRAVYDFAAQQPARIDSIKLTDLTIDGVQGVIGTQQLPGFNWLKKLRRHFFHRGVQRIEDDVNWRQREENTARESAFELASQPFFRQLGHPKNGFYMPQFTTPSFLKGFFFAPALPRAYGIREFHNFLRLLPNVEHHSYFPNKFLLAVGESTFAGRLSATCHAQMLKFNLSTPKLEVVNDYKIYSDRDT